MQTILRNLLAIALITGMTYTAEHFNEPEIIFPEIGALCLGLWIIPKQIWRIKRWQIPILFTLAALLGVMLVRYISLPWSIQLEIGFACVAGLLLTLRSTMTPALSACMLPIVMGSSSWIYPMTVFLLTSILAIGQWVLERVHWREKATGSMVSPTFPQKMILKLRWMGIGRWMGMMIVLAPILLFAQYTHVHLLVVPPLIVTLVEFTNALSGFRDRPFQIWAMIVLCACIGTFSVSVLHETWQCPLWICSLLTTSVILSFFHGIGKYFAPALALALVPQIIPATESPFFPIYVAIGAAYFIGMAKICFK